MLVTLVSVSGSDRDTTVSNHVLPGVGLYVIEQDGITSIAESIEVFFPDSDLTIKSDRDEAFEEYGEMLVDTDQYIAIPKRLC